MSTPEAGVIDAVVVETPPAPVQEASPAPVAPTPTAATQDSDIEDVSLVGEFKNVVDIIDRMIARAGSEAFVKAMQKSFATQTAKELKQNVYELIKAVAMRGGMVAEAFESLEEDFEDLQNEVNDQGRILRDIMSKSIVGLAWNLARLCLERVQDTEIVNLAQAINNAFTPSTATALNGQQTTQATP